MGQILRNHGQNSERPWVKFWQIMGEILLKMSRIMGIIEFEIRRNLYWILPLFNINVMLAFG